MFLGVCGTLLAILLVSGILAVRFLDKMHGQELAVRRALAERAQLLSGLSLSIQSYNEGVRQFVVDAPGATLDVLLRIYTVSGRLVRTLKSFGSANQSQLPWDGLDDEREPLANGVYLFRVNVNEPDPNGGSNPKAHAAAEGRFVVLNR